MGAHLGKVKARKPHLNGYDLASCFLPTCEVL